MKLGELFVKLKLAPDGKNPEAINKFRTGLIGLKDKAEDFRKQAQLIAKEKLGQFFKQLDDRLILPCQCPQSLVIVRIGQAADVEHQVDIERNAVLEAEGLEQQGQALGLLQLKEALYKATQGVCVQVAGVNAVTHFGDRCQRIALSKNGLTE